jgi:hypothetical protein
MLRDLWGNEVKEAVDYAEELIKELDNAQSISFEHNPKSRRGMNIFPKGARMPENAIHCIYRNNVPMYVGYSGNSTWDRISKFVGAVYLTLRNDERHIGAERYLRAFGQNLDGVTVRAVEFYAGQDLSVKVADITKEMAIILDASFNDVIYKKNNPDDDSIDAEEVCTLWNN